MVCGPTPAGSPIVIASSGFFFMQSILVCRAADANPRIVIADCARGRANRATVYSYSILSQAFPSKSNPVPILVSRIFASLASFALALMAVTLLLGLFVGDLHLPHSNQIDDLGMVHRMFGIAIALVVVLVNSIAVTYFVGTGRWCREVVETYGLDFGLVRRSSAIKRQAFPWAVCAMLVVVGVSALGAAADPATRREWTSHWVTPHLVGAIVGFAFIAWAFWQEWLRIREHHAVITEILAEVRRVRHEQGLEV
jgi:hypothetical protein